MRDKPANNRPPSQRSNDTKRDLVSELLAGSDPAKSRFGSLVDAAVARKNTQYTPRAASRFQKREDYQRRPQRSRSEQSPFDAFTDAVRSSEREPPPVNIRYTQGNRAPQQRQRDAGTSTWQPPQRSQFDRERPRYTESPSWQPYQRSPPNRERLQQRDTRPPIPSRDAVEPAGEAVDEAAFTPLNTSDEADLPIERKRFGKASSRNDRYADSAEEVEDSTQGKAGKKKGPRVRTVDDEMEEIESELYGGDARRARKKKSRNAAQQPAVPTRPRLEIPEFMSVQTMAQALGLRLEVFMAKLEEEGFEGARHDHLLDSGSSAMLAEIYGYDPILATPEAQQDLVARPPAEDLSLLPPRPPIVTIMGHVDHGKTTILDYLRKANVVASEHGGITQHIGAFSVTMPITNRKITFLDTPGHAAFLDMRRRGANVTDIVVLVVAADDSVKPQTIEAIKHAKEAGVQIIVAMNKVDKPDADVQKVKLDLIQHDIVVEDEGGDYQAIPLSGKTGQGMDALEEAIITLADVSDYRAETDGAAEGWIIESKVTTAGRVATVLVRRGTLRQGDFIVAGSTWARVRTLRNDIGDIVSEALPGTPVQIDGWRGEDPTAGLEVLQADDEQHAKDVVDLRLEKAEALRNATDMAAINASRSEAADARAKVLAWQAEQGFTSRKQQRVRLRDSREGWLDVANDSGPRKVHLVVKADVAGSVEAIVAAVSRIGNNDVQANVIHSGTGMLTESDIRMLATTGEVGYAISFNQAVDGTIYRLAEAAGLEILDHNVIYKVTDIVTEKVADELPPLITTKVLGEAEIGKIFDISKKKSTLRIAGCRVTNGTISRAQKVRVVRGNDTVYTGTVSSLKNVKKDVIEMRKGTECGIAFDGWEEMHEGDRVQCFEEISEKRKLY